MICLTFDTDWMSERALARFLDEFSLPGRATFFCHQPYRCLQGAGHEICPHPTLSDLGRWRDEFAALVRRVNPGARGTRTHSCVFSHAIAVGLHEMQLEYVSQASALYEDGVRPFRHPWGIWELPIYYMDNMDFWTAPNWPELCHEPFSPQWIERAVQGSALYVFDFHPVHVALNTRTPDDYRRMKDHVVSGDASPFDLAVAGRGARSYFTELCVAMAAAGIGSVSCSDVVDALMTPAA